jgi:hypothetical protein
MGLSSKLFLLTADEEMHTLAGTAFMRMLRQEAVARLPDFAGQRLRLASLVVELANREPWRVVHRSFSIIEIDRDGLLDVARLKAQQIACIDSFLAPVLQQPAPTTPVVDATSRFVARGGSWQPDDLLMRRIDAAALGRMSCRRVRVVR